MKIALTIWFVFNALVTIALIGRPRDPIEPGTAVLATMVSGIWIIAVWKFL